MSGTPKWAPDRIYLIERREGGGYPTGYASIYWEKESHGNPSSVEYLRVQPEPAAPAEITDAARDVLAERERQKTRLGWSAKHDDEHGDKFLVALAIAKAGIAGDFQLGRDIASNLAAYDVSPERFANGSARDLLVQAGALIVAEIERRDRSALAAAEKARS